MPTRSVDEPQWGPGLSGLPTIAPRHQHHDGRVEIEPLLGEMIVVAILMVAVANPFEYLRLDESTQTICEHRWRRPDVLSQLVVSTNTEERLS